MRNLILVCLTSVFVSVPLLVNGASSASSGPTPEMRELWSLLSTQGREKLGSDINQLEPQGRELAAALISPLDQRGIMTTQFLEENKDRYQAMVTAKADDLRNHRIELPLGQPARDVGNPIDWFICPENDIQWTQHLHYMYWVLPLCYSYYYHHNNEDAERFVSITLDWIKHFPDGQAKGLIATPSAHLDQHGAPTSYEGSFPSLKPGYGGPWISLATSFRVETWLKALQLIRDSPALTNERTATILVSLLKQHRQNLLDFPRAMNQAQHIAVQLICIGTAFPDFPLAVEAGEIGWARYRNLVGTEIYPDGSFAECSPNYDVNDLRFLGQILQLEQRTGKMNEQLAARFKKALLYFARTSDPLGRTPRIAKGGQDITAFLDKMCGIVNEPEAEFVATHGAAGTPPPLCDTFSWAGHHVFRSGWQQDATWAFFETGSRGSGHMDLACLNFQLIAGGQEFLADPGYYSYSNAKGVVEYSEYLHSTAAHNTALVDGEGQIANPWGASRGPNLSNGSYLWQDADSFASAEGAYTYGYGPEGKVNVKQTRKVTYLKKSDAFQIEDTFRGEGQHAVELRWQVHPDIEVQVRKGGIDLIGKTRKVALDIQCDRPFTIRTARGEKEPILGWYSSGYGKIQEATVLRISLDSSSWPLNIATSVTISPIAAPSK